MDIENIVQFKNGSLYTLSELRDELTYGRDLCEEPISFDKLKGLTFKKVLHNEKCIAFITMSDDIYIQYHSQQCCETVELSDVVGDFNDILENDIVVADEVENTKSTEDMHATWTFYKLATCKGYVDFCWKGKSNGYYSEKANLYKVSTC